MFGNGDDQGVFHKSGYLSLEIELDNKELKKNPYSRLIGSGYSRYIRSTSSNTHRYEITLAKTQPAHDLQQELRMAILCSPWYITLSEPQIKLVRTADTDYLFEIIISGSDVNSLTAVEDYMKKWLQKKVA